MGTPRRRSSRLKSDATPPRSHATPLHKLSSLLERDESPTGLPMNNIDSLISSPVPPPNTAITYNRSHGTSSAVKTPQTASRLYPSLNEMHPSKVHQSTVRPTLSRDPCGNRDPDTDTDPSKPLVAVPPQSTPSKATGLPQHMTSPSFSFDFERPLSDLSTEAQKIMESVRDEAAKIKAQMLEERNKQSLKDGEADQLYGFGGRKINKAKGKAGRYSDVHRQEFNKMTSIAGHASSWKSKLQDNGTSLKRSPSKAGLDQPGKPLLRTKSFKDMGGNESHERLENVSWGKRVKQSHGDDTSTATRPASREAGSSFQTTPAMSRFNMGLPSAVTTPTKASLARSASVKSMKTSMIPSLSRSASSKTLSIPAVPKTEGSNKYLSSLSRFGSMKSILHRSQPKFSNDPAKVAAGTHLPLPQGLTDLEKDFPKLSGYHPGDPQHSPTIKRVGFSLTPGGKSRQNLSAQPLSPSKIPTQPAQSQPEGSDFHTNMLDPVRYPDLANSSNVTTRVKLPRASTPGDFTFRADKTINFSPSKDATRASPGSTIRHVRPSAVSTHVPKFDSLPAIPHGMPNKKRSRPEPDTETEDGENISPVQSDESEDDQPRAKKQRMIEPLDNGPSSQSPTKTNVGSAAGSRIPKMGGSREKGRKGLTIGRLNMLARPKDRR